MSRIFKPKSENEIRKLISKGMRDRSTNIIRITPDIVEINNNGKIMFINEKTSKIFNMSTYESYRDRGISKVDIARKILKTFCS